MLSSLDCPQGLSSFKEISGCPQGSQDVLLFGSHLKVDSLVLTLMTWILFCSFSFPTPDPLLVFLGVILGLKVGSLVLALIISVVDSSLGPSAEKWVLVICNF